jgi:hypothetical protein
MHCHSVSQCDTVHHSRIHHSTLPAISSSANKHPGVTDSAAPAQPLHALVSNMQLTLELCMHMAHRAHSHAYKHDAHRPLLSPLHSPMLRIR